MFRFVFVASCLAIGLCDELIIRSEDSYRVYMCVCSCVFLCVMCVCVCSVRLCMCLCVFLCVFVSKCAIFNN